MPQQKPGVFFPSTNQHTHIYGHMKKILSVFATGFCLHHQTTLRRIDAFNLYRWADYWLRRRGEDSSGSLSSVQSISVSYVLVCVESWPVLSTMDLLIHLEVIDLDRPSQSRRWFSSTFTWEWSIIDRVQEWFNSPSSAARQSRESQIQIGFISITSPLITFHTVDSEALVPQWFFIIFITSEGVKPWFLLICVLFEPF